MVYDFYFWAPLLLLLLLFVSIHPPLKLTLSSRSKWW